MTGHFEIDDHGAALTLRVDGGRHSLFGLDIANRLDELVDRVERDPGVHAVVFTGTRPGRFVSHADVRWLQEEGAAVPEWADAAPRLSHASHDAQPASRSRWCAGRRCGEPCSLTACTRRS